MSQRVRKSCFCSRMKSFLQYIFWMMKGFSLLHSLYWIAIQQAFYYPRSSHTNIYGDSSVAHNTKDRFMTVAILKCELMMCVAIVNFWTRFTKLHQCVLNTCALWARSLKPSIKYVSPFVHDFWRRPLLCQQLSAFQHPLPKKSVSLCKIVPRFPSFKNAMCISLNVHIQKGC